MRENGMERYRVEKGGLTKGWYGRVGLGNCEKIMGWKK